MQGSSIRFWVSRCAALNRSSCPRPSMIRLTMMTPTTSRKFRRAHKMPEGDTIFRAARTLQRALARHAVTKFESVLPKLNRVDVDSGVVGRTIEKVEAKGKWMLLHFSGDL